MSASPTDRPVRPAQERSTRQKRALASILEGSDAFRSAQDLFTELRAKGENVGLTTVYSQLRALADAGEIDALRARTVRPATGDATPTITITI